MPTLRPCTLQCLPKAPPPQLPAPPRRPSNRRLKTPTHSQCTFECTTSSEVKSHLGLTRLTCLSIAPPLS